MVNWAVFSPHPPLLVPEIGGKMLTEVKTTQENLQRIFSQTESVDTVIVITPHGFASRNNLTLVNDDQLRGQLMNFGGGCPVIELEVNKILSDMVSQTVEDLDIGVNTITSSHINSREELLDHGAYVPLYYALEKLVLKPEIVIVNPGLLPVPKLWETGCELAKNLQECGQKIGLIISGDLSHSLSYSAPAGYHPQAQSFDDKIYDILQNQSLTKLLQLPNELLENAAECGYRPLVLGSGIIGGKKGEQAEVLSYEAPFGVGYLVARLV